MSASEQERIVFFQIFDLVPKNIYGSIGNKFRFCFCAERTHGPETQFGLKAELATLPDTASGLSKVLCFYHKKCHLSGGITSWPG